MSPTRLIDARKAMWTGTRVQLHIECRNLGTKSMVPWLSSTYGESASAYCEWAAENEDY